MKKSLTLLLASLIAVSSSAMATVAVSNYPLSLLSKAVTQGKGDAYVLLGAGDVGHHGSLSPQAIKQVHDSHFVVWFGGELEQNLVKSLDIAPNAISLFKMNAFRRLPMRDVDGKPIANSFDPHIWLDPQNAKAIVAALTVIHSYANPEFKADYHANAQAFYQAMDKATATHHALNAPYWVYHDAYQYAEKSLGLTFVGALTPDHHLSPKASRFRTLTANRPSPTMCLASQIPVSDGIQDKLSPLKTLVRQEDMSDGKDFVAAWAEMASLFGECVK